ncbi:MAG: hypothetical protein A3K06_03060 [Candidatus Doudnabacteria bacterium RIFCSPHIGHO2_01_52_17]|uniref:DUF5667 domain-containing protein n=1 Tax=Candidatus Doudnabacteria bacterium RIFCSPHIGHO2_01_52_17 TaxID=1817820 RepID=A0A1F5NA65_9BACT|nr:MAG: MJ0042 family finger-like protein [Parcubacteria group bacterium GW2011_GWA2_52_8]OGE74519.1 MAG: hypothetical protein A3K06_03060 [Candidatus Doudnabacteria bacterium RIFCSPHIGHO2_01_52_17]
MNSELDNKLERVFKTLPRKGGFDVSGKERIWFKIQNHMRQTRQTLIERDRGLFFPVFHLGRLAITILAVIIAITLVGGASKASEGSLPGDTLYSFKKASEKVEKILAQSNESKVKVSIKHAERRLREVQTLVVENKAKTAVVVKSLEDLKTATEQIMRTSSEINPELRFHVADLLAKEQEILDSVKAETEGELKAKVEEAITVSQESQAKLEAEDEPGAVEGTATAETGTDESGASATSTLSRPKDEIVQSDTPIHDVIKIDDNGDPQEEPEVLQEPTVGF